MLRGIFQRRAIQLSVVQIALCLAQPVLAEPRDQVEPGSLASSDRSETQGNVEPEDNVEEVVVYGTASMRDSLVRAESSTGFNMSEIETLQLFTATDALKLIPNTDFAPTRRGNNGITIRGINSEGSSPSGNLRTLSALVIDGAQQSFAAVRRGASSLWDVQRFEILPGPQSTLFGRNAAAGVIFIETADPTYHWETAARGTTGWFDQATSRAPTPDQWDGAFMLSGPIIDNQLAFRVSGQWIDDTHGINSLDPRYDYVDEGEYQQLRAKLLFEPMAMEGLRIEIGGFYTRNRPAVLLVTDTPPFSWRDYTLASESFATEVRTTEVTNVVGDISWEISENLNLYSLTAWTHTTVSFSTPNPAEYARIETRKDSDVTEDLRLIYNPIDSLQLLGGFFLAVTANRTDSFISFFEFISPPYQDQEATQDTLNTALFCELEWSFLESFSLTAGVRWDRDEYKVSKTDFADPQFWPDPVYSREKQATNEVLPRFILAWDFSDSQAASFTIARGYRPGFVDAGKSGSVVTPEYLWNYEIGYIGRFLEDRIQLRGNFFYYDWRNMQQQIPNPDPLIREPLTVNAARARGLGAEASITWVPFSGFETRASFGYLNTRYDAVDLPQLEGIVGNQFPEAPPFSAAIIVNYEHPSGFFGSADWSYRDRSFATGDVTNTRPIDSSSIFNARVGYDWYVARMTFFVNNILDTKYLLGADNFGGSYVGDRRLMGVQLEIRY